MSPTPPGRISPRAITVTAAAGTKVYDGTTSSTATPTITGGSLATGDTAAFTETFDTRNVGTGKTLTATGSVSDGNGGSNYAVTFVANTAGSVTALAITVTAATGTKVYDGTTSSTARRRLPRAAWPRATRRPSRRPSTPANVGTGKTLTAAGSVNDGNGGNNYAVTFVANTAGSRSRRGRSRSPRPPAPRSTTARRPRRPRRRSPRAACATGDTAAFTETFDTRNVGTGKTLTATGSVNDGNGGNNYARDVRRRHRRIGTSPLAITVTAAAATKVYDGTTSSTATPTITRAAWHGRHGGLHRDLRYQQRGHGQDAHGDRLGQRRQWRQQLRGDLRRRHRRIGHARWPSRSPRPPPPRATTVRPPRRPRRRSPRAAWSAATRRPSRETFDTRNVGTGKTLTAAGSVNDGNGGNNYTVTFVANTAGSITARAITVTAAAATKVYDGTTSSTRHADDHRRQPGHRRHGGLHRDLRYPQRGPRQDAHRGRLGQRRQRRQQLRGDLRRQHHGPDHGRWRSRSPRPPAPRSTTARPPRRPRRRSPPAAWPAGDTAAFTETFDTRNVGTGKTLTAAGSVNDGNGGNNYAVTFVANTAGSDHRAGDHGHRGHQHQGLRRHDVARRPRRRSPPAAWPPATRRPSPRPSTPATWARARRSRRPARSTTATAATTTR